jgi:hypothetical protein
MISLRQWNTIWSVVTAYCLLSTILFLIRFISYPVTSDDWWMGWATLGLGFEIHLLCNRIERFLAIDLVSSVVPLCIWHVYVTLGVCGTLWILGLPLINRFGRSRAQTPLATINQSIEQQNKPCDATGDNVPL